MQVQEVDCTAWLLLLLLLLQARAWGGGKQHFVGSFTSELDAARAYDKVG
jgi:hypothetical protein